MDTPSSNPPTFFSGLYDEALALTIEARDYLQQRPGRETARMAGPQALTYAHEITRLASQLIQSMAWLLAQRAVFEGEIEREIEKPEWRLTALPRHGPRLDPAFLPYGFADLSLRGERLFQRIERLDRLLVATA